MFGLGGIVRVPVGKGYWGAGSWGFLVSTGSNVLPLFSMKETHILGLFTLCIRLPSGGDVCKLFGSTGIQECCSFVRWDSHCKEGCGNKSMGTKMGLMVVVTSIMSCDLGEVVLTPIKKPRALSVLPDRPTCEQGSDDLQTERLLPASPAHLNQCPSPPHTRKQRHM
jgi:hypothetical protein